MADMTIDIERVVREVLAELQERFEPGAVVPPSAEKAATPQPVPQASPKAEKPASKPNELVVDCRVVALAELDGRLDAIRRLVVPRGAVVTPAVRDELDRRRIALSFATEEEETNGLAVRLVMVNTSSRFDPSPVAAALGKNAVRVEQHTSNCLIASTDLLAQSVHEPDTLGVLLSRHTAMSVCLANRHEGVRAVLATDVAETPALVAEVGANLLIVNHRTTPVFAMQRMLAEFAQGGFRPCPEVLRERLG